MYDKDARISKRKDGSTHRAHKAEHAVDLETGAIVAVTLQGADQGDTTTMMETVAETAAAVNNEADGERVSAEGPQEVVADQGYHSNAVLRKLSENGVRSYIPEPERGRRKWAGKAAEQKAVYEKRRRVRGAHGKRLMRRRGEYIERSFAHLYETGAMRRTHLRGRDNIRKRVLIHASAFNLSLVLRGMFEVGTPRGGQGRKSLVISVFCGWIDALMACFTRGWPNFGLRVLLGAEQHFAKHRPLILAA
jgi:transposase